MFKKDNFKSPRGYLFKYILYLIAMSGFGVKRERDDEGLGQHGDRDPRDWKEQVHLKAEAEVCIKVETDTGGDSKDVRMAPVAKKPRKSRFKDKDEPASFSSSSSCFSGAAPAAALHTTNHYGSRHGTSTAASSSKSSDEWGGGEANLKKDEEVLEKEKANFGLSGALATDMKSGNVVNGVQLKWSEPLDAAHPTKQWRLYSFKGEELVDTLHIHRQSAYLIGRDDRVVDIHTAHASCSKQHAVIQFRSRKVDEKTVTKPYVMDLGSANKTYLNGEVIDDSRYYELRGQDSLRFGASTREFVLIDSTSAEKNN